MKLPGFHYMVDLETMGTRPTSAIVSVGAVQFDPHSDWISDHQLYLTVDLESCIRAGLTMDASTVKWWLGQSDAARAALTTAPALALVDVLHTLSRFLASDARLWCHGPTFDAVILENAYRAAGLSAPWRYSAVRCTRTVYELAGIDLAAMPREGTHHNALDDAVFQAKAVQMAVGKLSASANLQS